jgi:hypothetical protein
MKSLGVWLLVVLASCGHPAVKGTPVPVPNPKLPWSVQPDQTSDWSHLMEAWLHNDSLVLATDLDVVAYDRSTGKPKWTVKPPANVPGRPLFCGASPAVSNDRIALVYGNETQNRFAACTTMTLLNLNTGKYEWQTRLGEPDEGINGAPTEAFLDFRTYTLLVGWDAYLGTYRVSDGARLSRHGLHHNSSRPNCLIRDLLSDRMVGSCLGPNMPDLSVATIDRNGTLGTVRDFTTGIDQGRFVSTDPPVLWTMQETKADYVVLDSGLRIRHTIPGAELAMDDLGPGNTVGGHRHHRVLMTGQTLITVTIPYPKKANKLVAYDLTTGQLRWETQVPNASILMPVAIDGSSILTVADTGTATTIRFNITDGSVESVKPHPGNAASKVLHRFRFFWADQRIYAVNRANNHAALALFTLD